MSTAQPEYEHDADATLEGLPTTLESSNSKLVYFYLSAADSATVDDLQSALDMKQLALFPVLQTLESEDLITRNGETYALAA
ncbi:TrmB family transcriptional regulator [Halalkalicoccus tibetensis]|uniref:TrmB family transcriptional regulator n=1 Tax=Halalkalicoccus tibetensis TaxID=175632 RepID=A0ABD5V899_9EURY